MIHSTLRRPKTLSVIGALLLVTGLAAGCGAGDDAADKAAGNLTALGKTLPQKIQDAGVLQVAILPDFPPQSFKDEKTNELAGFNVELVKAMGEELGIKIEFQDVKFDAMIPGLQASRYDLAAVGFNVVESRETAVDLVSMTAVRQSFLVSASFPDRVLDGFESACGMKVALLASNTYMDSLKEASDKCAKDGKGTIDIQTYPNDSALFAAVESGRADGTINNTATNAYLAKHSGGKLKKAEGHFRCTLAGFGVKKGQPELLKALQAAINAAIKDQKYTAAVSKWDYQELAVTEAKVSPLAGTYSLDDCSFN
ncbi:ABC transporter substrate-binding protein [Streptosporangium sp. NPDC051022]|uniref:ABC transporter substrate-binding protein n=1 Tax=Streptosporangium sp. NPDC051022 TaxID=3155752 RepID=UPI00342FF927